MMKVFQENIVKVRRKRNLSVEQAASLLSFNVMQLQELEEGVREPSVEELMSISKGYHVSYKKLLKKPKEKQRHVYKIKQKTLVGFNRYGLKQGWSVIAVPIMAFIALCMLFVPGFFIEGSGLVSIIKIMFANNVKFMVLGGIMICVLAYIIIYWTSVLAHGNYARARMKVTNNAMLAIFSGVVLILTLICLVTFKIDIRAGGVFSYIILFATSFVQLVLLIIMNLDGGEDSHEQVYIFQESDLSGYETKHWFTLGVVMLAIVSLCLFCTVVVFNGQTAIFFGINKTMFEMSFGDKASFMTMFIGGLCIASLIFDIVYWVIICTLKRADRRQTGRANNVLMVIINGILFISTVSLMSYFGFEYFTTGGILLYVSLFLTSIYAFVTIPVINCNKKSLYVEDKDGLHKVRAVQGQKPGKIMAYKFSAVLQYIMLALLAVSIGISFLDNTIRFVAYVSAAAFILEVVFLILQRNGRYVNIPIFIYGIVLNTLIGIFNIYLLGVSLFGVLNLGARIALPIVSGAIVIVYVCIAFFLKPIRDAAEKL